MDITQSIAMEFGFKAMERRGARLFGKGLNIT